MDNLTKHQMSNVRANLKQRSDDMELLESYSIFLEKEGYMDIDWRGEPTSIDQFMKNK